ncbi:acetate--CoA ligase family protein, partial [Dactylosporangium sp. NPDC049742]|uniref:acetate--CoA ligase family protein n=1 Tax=Dactylosporangium sp. NPDC049742 TaxID=3154737 RepID=UPI0034451B2A
TAPPPAWAGRAPTEDAAKRFLAGHGVAVAREVLVAPGGDVLGAAAGLRRPLVAKQLCVGIEHKSDLGLVAVGLRTDDEVRAAVEGFAAAVATHRLQPHGILLAEQATGAEVIVGGVRDPDFGPMVLVGAGGVLTEVFSDRVLARCPVTADEARAMLRGLRIWPVLDGYRGARHDVAALAELISRVSELLAGGDWIAALDLNPVIVGATGAVAVDAAVHVREA